MANFKIVKPLDPNKKSDKKFCIYAMGGLGDTIKKYLGCETHGIGWEYVSSIKSKYPDAIIKLVVLSCNNQSAEFYRYHPLVDCIVAGPWTHEQWLNNKRSKALLDDLKKDRENTGYALIDGSNFDSIPQKDFYLGENDKNIVGNVTKKGKYVVLHPFASEQSRMVMPIREYFPLVDMIYKNFGFNTVVVGANWTKEWTQFNEKHSLKETFNLKHDKLINTIGTANARAVAGLILSAEHLITVRSFCFSMTKCGRIDTSLLVSDERSKNPKYFTPRATIENIKGSSFGWSDNSIERIKAIGADYDYDYSRNEIINNIKRLKDEV